MNNSIPYIEQNSIMKMVKGMNRSLHILQEKTNFHNVESLGQRNQYLIHLDLSQRNLKVSMNNNNIY